MSRKRPSRPEGTPQTLAAAASTLELEHVLSSQDLFDACAEADALAPAGPSLIASLCERDYASVFRPAWWLTLRRALHVINGVALGCSVGLGITRGLAHQPLWYWVGLTLGAGGVFVQHRDLRRSVRRLQESEARIDAHLAGAAERRSPIGCGEERPH